MKINRFRIRYAVMVAVPLGALFAWFLVRPYLAQTNVSTIASPASASSIQVRPGFQINLFATGLNGPRFINFGPDGSLFVAERGANRIVALADRDHDGSSDLQSVFADELPRPHSLVYNKENWYVGVPSGVIRLADRDGDGVAEQRQVLIDDYPTGRHSTRTISSISSWVLNGLLK